MVPKKSASKRISASQRYKIKKKVNEHHRKARKEAKQNPKKRSLKKDPGIPNLFPLKEKLLLKAEEAKREAQENKSKPSNLQQFVQSCNERNQAFDVSMKPDLNSAFHSLESATFKDSSKRAYYKEFKKVIQDSDVILQVLDARDPLGCRTKSIEEMVIQSGTNKRLILILNKIDLIPRENVQQWLKFLRHEFPTIAFKSCTQTQRQNLSQSNLSIDIASDTLLKSSECLGADHLMKLLKNYCRNQKMKTSITVGVIGYPNVGKSSLINSLKRSKVCNVGATPGVTQSHQIIHLDKHIQLLDCPGIVFGKSNEEEDGNVMLRNCLKMDAFDDAMTPVEAIVSRCDKNQLVQLYQIPFFTDAKDFILQVAMKRGKLKRGGIPDFDAAAKSVLYDWNSGRIPYFTVPPETGVGVESQVSSEIVEAWSQEFELPRLVSIEGKDLETLRTKSEFPGKFLQVQSSGSLLLNEEMDISC